jgi:hypothetical protein
MNTLVIGNTDVANRSTVAHASSHRVCAVCHAQCAHMSWPEMSELRMPAVVVCVLCAMRNAHTCPRPK